MKLNIEYFILEHFKNSNKDITLRELQDKLEEFNKSVRYACWPDFKSYDRVYDAVIRYDKWLKLDGYTISFIGDRDPFMKYLDIIWKFTKPCYKR
jgi:hypothetical protein